MKDTSTLFPAPAGMIPVTRPFWSRTPSFPRTRGDDPPVIAKTLDISAFSPHPRG